MFEGANGAGKTSVAHALSCITGAPTISSSERLVNAVSRDSAHKWSAELRAAYYLIANRAVADDVKRTSKPGSPVIVVRYIGSTLAAYAATTKRDVLDVLGESRRLLDELPRPMATFFLDASYDVLCSRLRKAERTAGTDGRQLVDGAWFERLRKANAALAREEGWLTVDTRVASIDDIARSIAASFWRK